MKNFHKQHEDVLEVIDNLVQEGLDNTTKEPACEKGCFYCCTFPVAVGILELLYIAQKANELSQRKKNIIINNIETAYKYSFKNDKYIKQAYFNNTLHNYRTVCPFIHNGSCMIYEFRPSNCRTHFSTTPSLCQKGNGDMNFFKTPKVYSLINLTSQAQEQEKPKKGFLHNAFIFDGTNILVDPTYIFEDEINMDNTIKLSKLIDNS